MTFHQPGEQLKLFARPSEVLSQVNYSYDRDEDESMDKMWSRKEAEAKHPYGTPNPRDREEMVHGAGIYDSIKERGVTSHVHLAEEGSRRYLLDGHHRVAGAAAVERDTGKQQWVPLLHGNTYVDTKSGGFYAPDQYFPQNYDRRWDG